MTVNALIKELKKLPGNLEVYWADHDHAQWETNNTVQRADLHDKEEDLEQAKTCCTCKNDLDYFIEYMPKRYVVLRPW